MGADHGIDVLSPSWPFCSRGPRPAREFEGGRQEQVAVGAAAHSALLHGEVELYMQSMRYEF